MGIYDGCSRIWQTYKVGPRSQVVLVAVQLHQLSVVHVANIISRWVHIHLLWAYLRPIAADRARKPDIHLPRLLLSQVHENDRALVHDSVDDECGEDHNED